MSVGQEDMPTMTIAKLRVLEAEIAKGLRELEGAL